MKLSQSFIKTCVILPYVKIRSSPHTDDLISCQESLKKKGRNRPPNTGWAIAPPPLVEIGLTDLPNTGWAITQPTHPPVTPLRNVCANHLLCRTSLFTF